MDPPAGFIDPTAGFIRRVSEIEDENENDDEDDIQERLSRSESDPLEPQVRKQSVPLCFLRPSEAETLSEAVATPVCR
jgi:hypothetical protein